MPWVLDQRSEVGAEGHRSWAFDERTEFTTRLTVVELPYADITVHEHDKTKAEEGETVEVHIRATNTGGKGRIRFVVTDSEGETLVDHDTELLAGKWIDWRHDITMPARGYSTYCSSYHWE